ncbi:ATP-binding response regulator [Polaribacter cellanae]|uniref:histidine kinase n=1 Tax=Polaribacter cellanae TaxID=2818493 RepID=A0A975CLZ5_9FLAO|nr:ATP-binding protein [Polaribacter cellanae]QTE22386.1 response regulator [Polaribacter cellanae]
MKKKIDSLISISKNMLEKAQKETLKQRISLLRKESQLIENDLIISRKLQELLNTLEKDVVAYNNSINKQREKTLSRSKNIILLAAGLSMLIIIFFSITFLNDFWKSQRYRKQLEKANEKTSSLLKNREQIISMVSHDLRTPLSTITGYSELLQNSKYTTKESNYIDHISNASKYMGQLVNDLMEFSKLESGETLLESIPFDLKKLINEVTLSAKTLIKNKPIEFAVKHGSKLNHSIISDPFRIKQILTNLITNACKFTKQGSITIESFLKMNGNEQILEISVNDTGIGISKEQQKTIFKAFTQADTTKKSNRNGFGLGLTISKKLTELLNGTLTLKSELSKGSVFTLKIPVKISSEPIKSSESPKPEVIFNLNAIVVEDDASIRQLLKDFLKQYAIKSYIFSDAQSALEAVDDIPYDFVLTDIQLPKMNGIHFMETLKKQESYNNQPIIAMTGRLHLSKDDYANSGFSEVLIKPFRAIDLQNILHQFFGSNFLKSKTTYKINDDKHTNEFNITSLKTFLNNDSIAIKKTLAVFLQDTKKNILLLKQAKENSDLQTFNLISHTMLSMFKQLDARNIVPFLETFENAKSIDNKLFTDFKNALENFIKSLTSYLN